MNNQNAYLGMAVVAVITALLIFVLMQPPKEPEPETALGRAVEDVSEGFEDAEREITGEDDRTTGEKIGDSIEEAGEDIEEATDGDGE